MWRPVLDDLVREPRWPELGWRMYIAIALLLIFLPPFACQAQAQTRQLVDVAAAQVRTLVEAADEALERARGQRLAVTQAARGYEIATAQYREGLGSQLELTDAEVALRQSEFNYAQAVYDYLVARAQLDQATGRVPLVDVDVTDAGL